MHGNRFDPVYDRRCCSCRSRCRGRSSSCYYLRDGGRHLVYVVCPPAFVLEPPGGMIRREPPEAGRVFIRNAIAGAAGKKQQKQNNETNKKNACGVRTGLT